MDINALNGPKMTEGQIQAYLARLGIFETVPRTLAGLGRIQLAHKIMVPFENLDIVAGRPLSLDLHHLYDKIVVRGQGGVCAELNTLYNWLLYSMGFAVTSYNARMLSPPTYLFRRHRILAVELEGKTYTTDVGFATENARVPLELTEGNITKVAVDENGEAIGYQFVRLGKMMEDIRHGVDPKTAYEKNIGTYGRFADAPKYIDPREE